MSARDESIRYILVEYFGRQIKSFIVKKTIKLTPRPRMALRPNGATLQQLLTVHNTGEEPKKSKCKTTRVTNKNEEIY